MKQMSEVLVHWLDLKLPNWFALATACIQGLLGVGALGFLVLFFAPARLVLWLVPISAFAGANSGYKLWQKRAADSPTVWILSLAAGLVTGLAAAGLQFYVDARFFHTAPPLAALAAYICAAAAGSALGGWLRKRYERIKGGRDKGL
jgi:hypothetical protein